MLFISMVSSVHTFLFPVVKYETRYLKRCRRLQLEVQILHFKPKLMPKNSIHTLTGQFLRPFRACTVLSQPTPLRDVPLNRHHPPPRLPPRPVPLPSPPHRTRRLHNPSLLGRAQGDVGVQGCGKSTGERWGRLCRFREVSVSHPFECSKLGADRWIVMREISLGVPWPSCWAE